MGPQVVHLRTGFSLCLEFGRFAQAAHTAEAVARLLCRSRASVWPAAASQAASCGAASPAQPGRLPHIAALLIPANPRKLVYRPAIRVVDHCYNLPTGSDLHEHVAKPAVDPGKLLMGAGV